MLHTCNNTDIPPNPNKNDVIQIVKLVVFIILIFFTPFVNSIIPENIDVDISLGILKISPIFSNTSKTPPVSKIDRITEKTIINPPIFY